MTGEEARRIMADWAKKFGPMDETEQEIIDRIGTIENEESYAEEMWPGECICEEGNAPVRGHYNQAGGYCCPHRGNSCGFHPEYS